MLEYEARCPNPPGFISNSRVTRCRHDHDLGLRVRPFDIPTGPESAQTRHGKVNYNHIGQ